MEKNFNAQPNVALTPESIFLNLYVGAMQNLQTTWLDKDTKPEAFTIQIEFLRNLIPDKNLRDQISKEMDVVRKQVLRERAGQEKYADMHAGLAVIPHLISFICNTYNLLTEDVIGPGTQGFFKEGTPVEMPDYSEEEEETVDAD